MGWVPLLACPAVPAEQFTAGQASSGTRSYAKRSRTSLPDAFRVSIDRGLTLIRLEISRQHDVTVPVPFSRLPFTLSKTNRLRDHLGEGRGGP